MTDGDGNGEYGGVDALWSTDGDGEYGEFDALLTIEGDGEYGRIGDLYRPRGRPLVMVKGVPHPDFALCLWFYHFLHSLCLLTSSWIWSGGKKKGNPSQTYFSLTCCIAL